MELLKFDEIFNDEDISNYDLFIEKLKQIKANGHTTKDILGLIYQYYQKYVTYNYDQLQIVKIQNGAHPEINEVLAKYPHCNITSENAEQLKQDYINDLNNVFMKLEGRPLTQIAIDSLFGGYGTVAHHEARDYEQFGKKRHKDAYDEIQGINQKGIQPVYEHGMLVDGVCATYAHTFEKRICEALGIKHMSVDGVGTTRNAWSLIYLPEEQKWVHFDMTMVKFYQDGWIKEHEPYTEQDWVAATTEEIFKMQPKRQIHSINGKKCYFDKDNYGELDVREFLKISEVEPIHYPDKVLERPLKGDRGCIVTRKEMAQIVELPCLKATLLLYDKNIQTIGTSANKENIRTRTDLLQ